jgi:hypothetical protein
MDYFDCPETFPDDLQFTVIWLELAFNPTERLAALFPEEYECKLIEKLLRTISFGSATWVGVDAESLVGCPDPSLHRDTRCPTMNAAMGMAWNEFDATANRLASQGLLTLARVKKQAVVFPTLRLAQKLAE